MLRGAGLPITVAETLDALSAVRVVGVERRALRDGLAATLLKDEADRACFDAVFERCFPLVARQRGKAQRPEPTGDGDGHGPGKSGTQPQPDSPEEHAQVNGREPASPIRRHTLTTAQAQAHHDRSLSEKRRLQAIPFERMSPRDIEACDALVAELAQRFRAHMTRRQRAARRGRLDMRRTIRWSISKGGVPIQPAFRQRRPSTPDLVALCDCSHSVANATRFLMGLLQPAQEFFRRVRLFAFVDQAIEISFESGMLVPHARLDLYANSDFGRVLVRFYEQYEPLLTRNTILLILGDARNNRRPPRADILGRMHTAVRRIVWLNPEPIGRWNTGDSMINAYHRHCDETFAASTIRELYVGLRHSLAVT